MAVAFGMRNQRVLSAPHSVSLTPSVPRSVSRSGALGDPGGRLVQRSQNCRTDSPVRAPVLPIARRDTGTERAEVLSSRAPEPIVTWLLDTERPLGTKCLARDASPLGPRMGNREKRGIDTTKASQASNPSPGTSPTRASAERNVDVRRIELLEEELGKLAEVTKDLSTMWDERFAHLMACEERPMNVTERHVTTDTLDPLVPVQKALVVDELLEKTKDRHPEVSQFQERIDSFFSDVKSDMVMLNFRVADLEVRNSDLEQQLAQHPNIPDVDRLHARLDREETLIEEIQKSISLGSALEIADLSDRVGKLANKFNDMESRFDKEYRCGSRPRDTVTLGVADCELTNVVGASGQADAHTASENAHERVQELFLCLARQGKAIDDIRQACNLAFEKHVQKFVEIEAKLGNLDRNIISALELKCLRGRIDSKELDLTEVKQATTVQSVQLSELKLHVQKLDHRLDDVDMRVQVNGVEPDTSKVAQPIADIMCRLDSVERGKADTDGLIRITEVVRRNGKSIDSLQDSVGALASHFHQANEPARDGTEVEREILHRHWAEPLATVSEAVEEEYDVDDQSCEPHGVPESQAGAGLASETAESDMPLTSARVHRRIAEVSVVPEMPTYLDGEVSAVLLGLDTDVRPIKAQSERYGL